MLTNTGRQTKVSPLAEEHAKILDLLKSEKLGKPNLAASPVTVKTNPGDDDAAVTEIDDDLEGADPDGVIPQYREFARRLVGETIKLIVDDPNLSEKQLGRALRLLCLVAFAN